jgi:hypothetical protein
MTWLQFSVFELFLEYLPHRPRQAAIEASRAPSELTHQAMLELRAAKAHLDELHTPHLLSGPGARLFQHLV